MSNVSTAVAVSSLNAVVPPNDRVRVVLEIFFLRPKYHSFLEHDRFVLKRRNSIIESDQNISLPIEDKLDFVLDFVPNSRLEGVGVGVARGEIILILRDCYRYKL